MHYFSKNLTNRCAHFSPFGQKTQIVGKFFDENSIEKLNFIIFGKFVTKIRAFGNNPIFYNNFFGFGGGGYSPLPPPKSASVISLKYLSLLKETFSGSRRIMKEAEQVEPLLINHSLFITQAEL